MSGDVQVRFCERPRVRPPRATHPVVHCVSEEQAKQVLDAIRRRLAECGLELHPTKTRIVYCKDDDTNTPRSTFSAIPFNLDERRTGGGATSLASFRR
jgi:hypothetical protein